jgi:hypothetical protein
VKRVIFDKIRLWLTAGAILIAYILATTPILNPKQAILDGANWVAEQLTLKPGH